MAVTTNPERDASGSLIVTVYDTSGDPAVLTAGAAGAGVDGPTVQRVSLATDVPLPAGANVLGKVDHTTTGFGDGVKTVTAAGTDEALAGSTAAKWVTIQAQPNNTSKVAIGATGVDATIATGDGVLLDPGDSIGPIPCDNLADIFVDALVSGEGVRYVYGT